MNDNINDNMDPNDPAYANNQNDPNMPQQSQQAPYSGMPNESEPAPAPDGTLNPPYTGMPNEVNMPVGGIAGNGNPSGAAILPGALAGGAGGATGAQQNGDTDPIRDQPILGGANAMPLNDQPGGSGMGSSAFSTSNTGYNANYGSNDPTDPNNPDNQAPITDSDVYQRDPSLQPQANPTGAPDYAQAQAAPVGGLGGVAGGSNTPASASGNTSDIGAMGASNVPNVDDATGDTSSTGLVGAPSQTDIATSANTGVAGDSNLPNATGAGYTGVAGAGGTTNAGATGIAGSPTQTGDYYGQSMDQTQRPANDPGAVYGQYGQMGTSDQPLTTDPSQLNQPMQPNQAGAVGPDDDVDVNGAPLPLGQSAALPDRQAGGAQMGGTGQVSSGLDNEPITGSPDHPRTDDQILNDSNVGMP